MYSSVHIHIHSFICTTYLFHFLEYWSTFLFLNVISVNSVIFTERMKTSLTSIFLDLEILPSFLPFLTFSFCFNLHPIFLLPFWKFFIPSIFSKCRYKHYIGHFGRYCIETEIRKFPSIIIIYIIIESSVVLPRRPPLHISVWYFRY